jgi:FtsP/CotA-like multicopper oxidase with cupredoxin domain
MRGIKNFKWTLLRGMAVALMSTLALGAHAAAPGITGLSFDLVAHDGYISQPDGQSVYSWGYGCNTPPAGYLPLTTLVPATCTPGQMQLPGPTLIVTEGQTVTVTLTNKLPAAAGNTSILFPGFRVCAGTISNVSTANPSGTCTPPLPATPDGVPGLLVQEAANGSTVSYQFVATSPGTHSYYSGTQGDLQIEMGLYGALIVLPASPPSTCDNTSNDSARAADRGNGAQADFRLAHAAYDNAQTCYDREYLFQFSEMDPAIHQQAREQKDAPCSAPTGCMVVQTEPYHSTYFMINGRSMPDDMDPNYASQYPLQPYNGNPHMHPGELTLLRIIGQGRMQHPFHEHGNHVRVLARDGNLQLTSNSNLAGPLLFTTTTTPGQTIDGIFVWTGKNLNWDVYGHRPSAGTTDTSTAVQPCTADANGYYTTNPAAPNYYEWCGDHNKALESHPFGDVGGGGPVTLPDPNILTNGSWYGGSAYLGPDATVRAVGSTPIPPSGTIANSPTGEAGYAFMWHSHNEREITTNNIFPGGMMMLMLVDPWVYVINEAN